MDYGNIADEIKKKVMEYTSENESWKVVKKADQDGKEVTVYCRPSTEFSGSLYKAEGIIDANPAKVLEFVAPKPDGYRVKWDKAIKFIEMVDLDLGLGQDYTVVRTGTHSAAMGLISPREFVDLCISVKTDNLHGTMVVVYENTDCERLAQSIDHPKCPSDNNNKFVRGTNHPCGICCFKVEGEPEKTRLVHICQADLGGMLPKQLVEQTLPGTMVDFFQNLRQALSESLT